ncbi:MAG: serine/threonine protein kinase [Scytonematopsis contorta HA4267-MV1]|nr:serine/threonine protein kinase [Scytonematopsis contorta HA4267-MV1]
MSIQPGLTLGERYLIVRQLGQGGFGRTYLAEDINRFRELCVLKEFYPQVQTPYVLQKAEELFQREASVLYKLQHPQIPRFRELFRMNLDGNSYLFLVQDYVDGSTYGKLLEHRKQQGLRFSEAEVRQLLLQILPVLDYVHSMGVIHRDISPDNIIHRNIDQLPVLIDFGGVKQVAANVASQYYQQGEATLPPSMSSAMSPSMGTLLGKIGYSPPEQMQTGLVEPHSDLYALAATIVVLLTGKQPQELIDTYNLTWQWRREVNLSHNFAMVLDQMLSPLPGGRFQSARQLLEALVASSATNNYASNYAPTVLPNQQTQATVPVAPPPQKVPTANQQIQQYQQPQSVQPYTQPSIPAKSAGVFGKTLLLTLVLGCVAGVTWFGANSLFSSSNQEISPQPTNSPTSEPSPTQKFSAEEQARKEKLRARREQLGVDYNFYISLVNQVFRDRNPSLQGRTLSDSPEDEALRARWDKIAAELLEKLAPLSSDARRQLGTYTSAQRDAWKLQVNNINVGSRSLYDLTDGTFFLQFPEQRGRNFLDTPVGQVWSGIANDKLNAILANTAFRKLVFKDGAIGTKVSGTFKAGEGKVFIAGLAKDQQMEVKLSANSKVLLSVYSPSGTVNSVEINDSTQRTLSAKLPEDGYYEFVIVNTGSSSTDYQLSVTAESAAPPPEPTPTETPVTPNPSVTPTPTATATPTATPTNPETPNLNIAPAPPSNP